MNIRLIRNATLFICINKKGILVDPMLGPKGSFGKFPWTDSKLKNPLVDLPLTERDLQILIKQTDAILLTHMHPDHWDSKAQGILSREIPIYCQPEDMPELNRQKFTNLTPVNDTVIFEGITIIRTKGKHTVWEK
ncbi:UNVERIFIED_CONTAM: L-ascorbate metabolism protein UlaG (beta-lactamase superfamily) [Pseudacidovorax intermedius]|nr:L-ascorbate metabolism protein UlaG (beta-lactamase superfamily) [Pseudacidovorax intermedius]